jgi:hypothetical protein
LDTDELSIIVWFMLFIGLGGTNLKTVAVSRIERALRSFSNKPVVESDNLLLAMYELIVMVVYD